ncbi:LacI family transcriptional regulator [Cnuibacter physcomitrellae]|uniref:LacI family transcriptional regulator n=1 Tax=Cnuibacter physcomitrellae TaxID=1619308 RepID=A0A1X9LHU5_9MICO|nr:LacI family DNA-binding transcriptional regulator [Cnuibacter physcomitrellae]ARJ03838.1 LacI family transcriptional regulator [Cnuibacter physcomitrellae]MCS5497465.1 LacI family transcriptional regulator [Cnuibacter physcomitrellae]GGI39618.1 LacI family transcriptional regulator [Cnuibacter physcomitrellae]
MERKPTIIDVAQRAGVSKGLVSFALNGRPGVAPETRDRILQAADELGFRPSIAARSLSTRTSYALGLVVARDPEVIAADPFFPSFISGVERVLAARGRALVLSVVTDDAAEAEAYRAMAADGRVDGVFLTDLRADDERPQLLAELGLPAVTLGRVPSDRSRLPAVVLDDTPGITEAVRHLIGLGHRRIAHVAGPSRLLHAQRRRQAFEDALAAHGLAPARILETDFSAREGANATSTLLADPADERVTAIVYANDPMAIAGLGVAQQNGFRLPDDLSITGFDDSEIADYVYPSLTSARTRPSQWGQEAARTLLDLVEHGSASDVDLPPAGLVVRASTAPPRS